MKNKLKHKYIFFFLVFLIGINFPVIGLFNFPDLVLSSYPLLVFALFVIWLLIIVCFFYLSEVKKNN